MTNVSAKLQLARELMTARVDLERRDEALEIYVYQGTAAADTYATSPSSDYADEAQELGKRVTNLALRFSALFPDRFEVARELANAGRTICRNADAEAAMAEDDDGYGRGWGEVLDTPCEAVNAAIEAVFADIEKQAFVSAARGAAVAQPDGEARRD